MTDIAGNKAIIQTFHDRSDRHDDTVYDDMLAPDFTSHGGPAGEIHGREAFKQAFAGMLSAFSDFKASVDLTVAEGDYVAVYGYATATHDGPFLGMPPTGRSLRWTSMIIYRLDDDGKIAERWQEIDALGMMGQLGMLPPMGGGPGGPGGSGGP